LFPGAGTGDSICERTYETERNMAYFPFFIELEGKQCLVVGGGDVAFRKIRELIPFGVSIRMVAPEICDAIRELAAEYPKLTIVCREYEEKDLEGMFFVIAATDDEQCNCQISERCRQRRMLVNVVDDKDKCSFYFPSLVKQGDIVAGFSSGGNSPALIKGLRRELQEQIPEYYGQLNAHLGQLRPAVKEHFDTEEQRKQFYRKVIHRSRELSRALSVPEMEEILHKGFTQN